MGAWSTQPFGNDTAGGWFDGVMRKMKIVKYVDAGLKSKSHDEARAAAFMLERFGYGYVYPIDDRERQLKLAIDRMQTVLDDKEWIGSWEDKNEIRQAIRKQMRGLKNQLHRKNENLLLDKF